MVLQPSCLAKLDTTAADAVRAVGSYGAGKDPLWPCRVVTVVRVAHACVASYYAAFLRNERNSINCPFLASWVFAEVWDGEGADHTATGGDFGHDFLPTFQSSFYYAWLQGALPLNGVSLAARQCLIGGNCK